MYIHEIHMIKDDITRPDELLSGYNWNEEDHDEEDLANS